MQGYFIVAYGLGIYLLNNFIAFLSPLEDPSSEPGLPTTESEGKEYRPFAPTIARVQILVGLCKGSGNVNSDDFLFGI